MDTAKQYDLTANIIVYLDKHLALPIIEFLSEKKIYDDASIAKLRYDILSKTKMVDCIIEEHKKLNLDTSKLATLESEKTDILKQLETLRENCGVLNELFESSKYASFRENIDSTLDELNQKSRITTANISAVYNYGRLLFEVGRYPEACMVLYVYRQVGENEDDVYNSLWGSVAAGILDGADWESVTEDVLALRDSIDQRSKVLPAEQVQQRVWFLHWVLFLSFNHAPARTILLDCLHTYSNTYVPQANEKMLNAMLLCAPHLLRYLTVVAIISNKQSVNQQQYILKRNQVIRELVKVVTNEYTNYTDPFTEYVYQLLTQFDFNAASVALNQAYAVAQTDFFISSDANVLTEFLDSARALFIDTYLRVHVEVNVKQLCDKYQLNFTELSPVEDEVASNSQNLNRITTIHQLIRDRARSLTNRPHSNYNQNRA